MTLLGFADSEKLENRRRPRVDQIVGIHTPDAGGEVPASLRAISRLIGAIRSGEHTASAGGQVAVDSAPCNSNRCRRASRHRKRTNCPPHFPGSNCKQSCQWRPALGACEAVVDVIRLALAFPDFLVHQCLNARHDRRRERCPARSRPLIRRFGAGNPSGSAKAVGIIRICQIPFAAKSATSGMSRTPSLGFPSSD